MIQAEFHHPLHEIELALAGAFDSPEAIEITHHHLDDALFLQISWRVAPHSSALPDAQCLLTLRLSRGALGRYARLDAQRRRVVQGRLGALVRGRAPCEPEAALVRGDMALQTSIADALVTLPEEPW